MCAWIGVDLGTTGVRSTVYDEDLAALGSAYLEYPMSHPAPGWVEQDARQWWDLTARVVRQAIAACGLPAGAVAGIAVSSQGISVVPVDADFEPLRPAISWLDTRAGAELAEICADFPPEALYRLTGKRASAAYTLPKLLWLRRHEPEMYDAARWFLMPQDYLVARMTGRAVTDHTLASGTMLYELEGRQWSSTLCGRFGLDPTRLPALKWAGEPVGQLTPAAAQALGLTCRTLVSVGAQDQKCAALAAGLSPGVTTISLGTAAAVETLGAPDAAGRIPCFSYLAPGQTVLEGVVNTAGLNLRWLRDKLLPNLSYREIDALAEGAVGKSRVLCLPFLGGEGSPGWGEGRLGSLHRLDLQTGAGDIACAVMEGVAFELRRNLEAMAAPKDQLLRLFGGGAKSSLWCGIIASATGRLVQAMQDPEMACLGAALLAVRAGGRPPENASPATASTPYRPDPNLAAHYEGLYSDYLEACSATAGKSSKEER